MQYNIAAMMVEILLRHGVNERCLTDAFLTACGGGSAKITALLIEHGAIVDAHNGEALVTASRKGFVELVALLIKHGADVRAGGDAALRAAFKTASESDFSHIPNWRAVQGAREVIALLHHHGVQLPEDDNF
jgi:ankyrin repeat protein